MNELATEKFYNDGDSTTLAEIRDLANELLGITWTIDIYKHQPAQHINLSDKGWRFEFNSRKRAAGLCEFAPSRGRKVIYISEWLLKQNLEKASEFENTLRHELAHALDYEMRRTSDHSRIWKAIAKQVLCTAERCYTSDQIAVKVKTKYTLICDTCGKQSPSHKIKRRVSACGDCCRQFNGGKFSEQYALRQVQNY